MKSAAGEDESPLGYEFASFLLDPARRQLTDRASGLPVDISGKTFDALLLFVEHAGSLLTRAQLIHALWPRTIVEDNNLNKLIANLRRVLGDSDGRHFIVTVQGRGYQFVAPVQLHRGPPAAVPVALLATPPRRMHQWTLALVAGAAIGVSLIAILGPGRNAPANAVAPIGALAHVSSVTTFPGDELSPSLSPDGTQVAFSWNGAEGNSDIYVMLAGPGASPLRLTQDPATDRDPAWSPDGSSIAFLRQRDPQRLELMIIPALGGEERSLQSVAMNFVSRESSPRLAWTADSRQLVFTTQLQRDVATDSYHLYRLPRQGGAPQPLTSGAGVYDTSPAISADNRLLAFSRFRSNERLAHLMLQKLDARMNPVGEPVVVPGLPAGIPHSPTWSADGQLVFVIGSNVYDWRLSGDPHVVYSAAGILGGSMRGSTVAGLSLHRDARVARAVASKLDNAPDIWVLPLDPRTHAATGAAQRRLSSTGFEQHPRFSPDGRQLAFVSDRGGNTAVWIAEASGALPRQLTHLASVVTGYPHWSPDGRQLAFHASFPEQPRRVFIVDALGGSPRPMADGCCPEWSADGRYLWFDDLSAANSIVRLRLADGVRERLFDGDLPFETPDGRRLIYADLRRPGLFQRRLDGGVVGSREEMLVPDYTPTLGGIAPTEDGFYYVGHTPEGRPRALRFYDYLTRTARDIAVVPGSIGLGLTISKDGRELLYAAGTNDSGSDLVRIDFSATAVAHAD